MRVLVVGPNGKTGSHLISALQALSAPPQIVGFSRSGIGEAIYEHIVGDMESPADRKRAVEDIDVVFHYGPALHPRETAIGTGMIDSAIAAGVKRFIYISVIHPQIENLLNHKTKLAVEAHLINSGIDWTILRPQHYMQNVDVPRAIATGELQAPYRAETTLGHVDMVDLAEAAAKVLVEDGHSYAAYDISSDEHLSVIDICEVIGRIAGKMITPKEILPEDLIAMVALRQPITAYQEEAAHRLFGYYGRRGIRGNSNVLSWLLGRAPSTFEDYVRRRLHDPVSAGH